MIKSLLHFNNPNDLTKDEVKGVYWEVHGTVDSSQNGKFGNCLSISHVFSSDGYLYLYNKKNKIDLSFDKEWTLDMWVYLEFLKDQTFFQIGPAIHAYDGNLKIQLSSMSYWEQSLNLPVNSWAHFALVNQSQTLYAFVNGVKQVERTNQDIYRSPYTIETRLGSSEKTSYGFIGLIDEVRISDEALWTSDFTPPATEYHQDKFIYIDKNNTVMGMRE